MKSYKETYKEIYSKINLEEFLKSYKIDVQQYFGNKGKELKFSCPFPDHDDLTPSFSLNVKHGFFHCFLCGGGDFIKLVKILENLNTTGEAIKFLKNKLKISDDPNVSFDLIDSSFKNINVKPKVETFTTDEKPVLKEIKLPNSEPADKHFDIVKKRVSLDTIKKWGLKYCSSPANRFEEKYVDRLIIPMYFENKLVTFAARDMSGRAEYWNKLKKEIKQGKYSEEESKLLIEKHSCKKILYPFAAPISYIFFNWDKAIQNKDYVILVEGALDAMKLDEYDYNVVAILSTHINEYRVNMLIKNFKTIYISLDNDDSVNSKGIRTNPGQEAANKIMKDQLDDINVYNIVLPLGKDPDECTAEEFKYYFEKSKKSFPESINFNLFKK